MTLNEILRKGFIDFWKHSGKEWSCQYMTNEEMKIHEGFKGCLEDGILEARTAIINLVMEKIPKDIDLKISNSDFTTVNEIEIIGYNSALSDMREAVKKL